MPLTYEQLRMQEKRRNRRLKHVPTLTLNLFRAFALSMTSVIAFAGTFSMSAVLLGLVAAGKLIVEGLAYKPVYRGLKSLFTSHGVQQHILLRELQKNGERKTQWQEAVDNFRRIRDDKLAAFRRRWLRTGYNEQDFPKRVRQLVKRERARTEALVKAQQSKYLKDGLRRWEHLLLLLKHSGVDIAASLHILEQNSRFRSLIALGREIEAIKGSRLFSQQSPGVQQRSKRFWREVIFKKVLIALGALASMIVGFRVGVMFWTAALPLVVGVPVMPAVLLGICCIGGIGQALLMFFTVRKAILDNIVKKIIKKLDFKKLKHIRTLGFFGVIKWVVRFFAISTVIIFGLIADVVFGQNEAIRSFKEVIKNAVAAVFGLAIVDSLMQALFGVKHAVGAVDKIVKKVLSPIIDGVKNVFTGFARWKARMAFRFRELGRFVRKHPLRSFVYVVTGLVLFGAFAGDIGADAAIPGQGNEHPDTPLADLFSQYLSKNQTAAIAIIPETLEHSDFVKKPLLDAAYDALPKPVPVSRPQQEQEPYDAARAEINTTGQQLLQQQATFFAKKSHGYVPVVTASLDSDVTKALMPTAIPIVSSV